MTTIKLFILFLPFGLLSCAPNNRTAESGGAEIPAADSAPAEQALPQTAAAETASQPEPFEQTFSDSEVSLSLSCPNKGSQNILTVVPSGFKARNETLTVEVNGFIMGSAQADLDNNGFIEAYAFARSADSGSYGAIYGFASYRNRSYGQIFAVEPNAGSEMLEGYRGHDKYFVEKGKLKRVFPIYKEGDDNANPTGGKRVLTYELKQGEASFILEPVGSEKLKK